MRATKEPKGKSDRAVLTLVLAKELQKKTVCFE